MSEWIKCSDRVPPDGKLVWGWYQRAGAIGVYAYDSKNIHHRWWSISGAGFDQITHWMPLPPPPIEGE